MDRPSPSDRLAFKSEGVVIAVVAFALTRGTVADLLMTERGFATEVKMKANEIIDVAAEQGLLSGKSPTGFAAAPIYAASLLCNEKQTQREVAEVAQVTEVTIRNRYQEQIEVMGIQ